jgi:nucleoside 2-deoxyribosyltransferase
MLIYLAGGLFNAGQRLHNLVLEKYLKELGHTVILPQRRALDYWDGEKFSTKGIVADCARYCADPTVVYVGNIDGPDADDGTAVEYGIAIAKTGRAVIYRTDFRTAEDRELGINAMFGMPGTKFLYPPCLFTELDEWEDYYRNLAGAIDGAIRTLRPSL